MKLTFVLLTAVFLNVSANGLSQKISFSGKNVSLEKIFNEIEKQTGYGVTYTADILIGAKPVTIHLENSSLKEFLEKVLINQQIEYAIEGTTILLSKKLTLTKELKSADGILAPPGSVQGRIMNENGEPLAGASVSVKGTNLVAVADAKGYYSISNIAEGDYTLEVSYIGYKTITKVVKINTSVSTNFEMELNPYGFNDVVVSANLVASKKREIASAVTTITSKQIEQLPISNIAELFRSEVPGAISWSPGPGSNYNDIKLRGDIDFNALGESTVKIFIDGIEVANGSFLSTLPLSSIDHIEVLHGPQASTLYGSGATSGVVYIFTKKGKIGGPHINAKISAGTIASKWVDKTAYQQDHSLTISGGSEGISYNFGGSYFHYDPYWEDGNNTNTSGFASVKAKQGNFTVELIGQYSTRKYGSPLLPILKDSFPSVIYFTTPYNKTNTQNQQTLGLNMLYKVFTWWQHNFSIGIDQNAQSSVQTAPTRYSPDDTLNSRSNVNYSRKSYRYYTTLRLPTGSFLKSTITAGFDHYLYESSYTSFRGTGVDPNFSPVGQYSSSTSLQKYSNTGYYAQGVFGFANKFFLTAGVRNESTKQFGNSSGNSIAPKIGASFVQDLGGIMIKPRVGYGKSIKVPEASQFVEIITVTPSYTVHQFANPDLKPQEQVGYDVGLDIEFSKGIGTFEATYYNQDVNNFITVTTDFSNYPLITSQYINVGKIKNSGFEFAGTLNLKPVKFRFTYSITNSIVGNIANTGYEYYYQKGDRILGIPKSSGGATITYTFPSLFKSSPSTGGHISLGATYFGDWVNQDDISYTKDMYINFDYSKIPKDYVINYSGYALFRLEVNYNINKNLEAFLNINNLFNSQKFESINIIPTQGRATMLGIRISY